MPLAFLTRVEDHFRSVEDGEPQSDETVAVGSDTLKGVIVYTRMVKSPTIEIVGEPFADGIVDNDRSVATGSLPPHRSNSHERTGQEQEYMCGATHH